MTIKSVKMKISKNKKNFVSHVPRIILPKNQVPRSNDVPYRLFTDGRTDGHTHTHRQSDYCGHLFRVSGFFPSIYHQGLAQFTFTHLHDILVTPQILFAAHTLAQHCESKVARENLEVLSDAWESQINDLSILVKEVNDVCQGRGGKVVYLSLPRPGVSTLKQTRKKYSAELHRKIPPAN